MNELKGSGQTPGFEKLTRITLTPGQVDDLRGKIFGSIGTIFTTGSPLNPSTKSFLNPRSIVSVLKEGPSPEEQIISWFGEQIVRPSIKPPTFTEKLIHAAGEAVNYLAPKLVKTATGLTVFVPMGNMPDNIPSYTADFTLQNPQPIPVAAIDRPSNSIRALSLNYAPVSENLGGDSGGANSLEIVQQWGYTGPGFQSIAMNLPSSMVGKALGPETPLANGDVMQLTENGAMFWRKADNWTAYTDGSRTWVMGPYGLQERGNDERFDWEKQAEPGQGDRNSGSQSEKNEISPEMQVAYQKMSGRLKFLLDAKTGTQTNDTHILINPLFLNPDEVSEFINTGRTEGYSSFKFLFNSKNQPVAIVVTGGTAGLKEGFGNIENTIAAVKRINEIDPEMIDLITEKYGLKAISGDGVDRFFKTHPGHASGFTSSIGEIGINEVSPGPNLHSIDQLIVQIITESRHMYTLSPGNNSFDMSSKIIITTVTDSFDRIPGVDKALFVLNWAEKNKSKFTPQEYQSIISYAQLIRDTYLANPNIGL